MSYPNIKIHLYNDNELRRTNRQCIPMSFLHDNSQISDCIDRSDEFTLKKPKGINFHNKPPLFENEEQNYLSVPLGNVDLARRASDPYKAICLVKDNSMSDQC
ncbi:unnamed protein product, partial [Rotaria sp. Silwood1]